MASKANGADGRRSAIRKAVASAMITVAVLGSFSGSSEATGVAAQNSGPVPQPANIVILVDESGSISPADMAREQEAASIIAQADLSARSTVSVVGFASDNGARSPVDIACPPLVISGAAERDRLSRCVGDLRKRTRAEGDGTDHAEALRQGLSYATSGTSGPRVIFLLTDGALDVSDSPRYGVDKTATQRNGAAKALIEQSLSEARDNRVQVWPLGFGHVDKAALDGFAAGGYQGTCGASTPKPSATIVSTSADVAGALLRAHSSSRCVGGGRLHESPLPTGGTIDVPVTIPAIATDGSIVVVKRDSRVAVEYIGPDGEVVPKSGTVGGATYEVSGESGAVEVLRVVNPRPGRWTARITSVPDLPAQSILTAVTWQGAAQTVIVVDPPAPAPGQPVTVSVRVVLRGGRLIADPELLRGLTFSVELTGVGNSRPVPLDDSGAGVDSARDGTYSGRVTIPGHLEGTARFMGRVTGIGINAADAAAIVEVADGPPPVLATADLPTVADTVAPGGAVTAKLSVTNNSGGRRAVRLAVRQDSGGRITIPAGSVVHHVDPGNSAFTAPLVFAADSPTGPQGATLLIIDDDDPETVFNAKTFSVNVAYPVPVFPRLVVPLGALALVTLVGLLVQVRSAMVKRRLGRLVVHVISGTGRESLPTGSSEATEFRFTVAVEDGVPKPRSAQRKDAAAYVLRRKRGNLRLVTPSGEHHELELETQVELPDGILVSVYSELESTTPV